MYNYLLDLCLFFVKKKKKEGILTIFTGPMTTSTNSLLCSPHGLFVCTDIIVLYNNLSKKIIFYIFIIYYFICIEEM